MPLLLCFILIIVNLRELQRADGKKSLDLLERNDDGADVNKDVAPFENHQQTLIKYDKDDGPDPNDLQKEGQAVRFETTNTDIP